MWTWRRVRADHPLRAIRPVVNEALAGLGGDFDLRGRHRPAFDPAERLLRALLLQRLCPGNRALRGIARDGFYLVCSPPVPARHYPPHRLALSALHRELQGRRGTPRRARRMVQDGPRLLGARLRRQRNGELDSVLCIVHTDGTTRRSSNNLTRAAWITSRLREQLVADTAHVVRSSPGGPAHREHKLPDRLNCRRATLSRDAVLSVRQGGQTVQAARVLGVEGCLPESVKCTSRQSVLLGPIG